MPPSALAVSRWGWPLLIAPLCQPLIMTPLGQPLLLFPVLCPLTIVLPGLHQS